MRFAVEDLSDYGGIILYRYSILNEYNPILDYPYKNEKTGRLTIEIDNINDLVNLQNKLDKKIMLKDEYSAIVYNDGKDKLPILEIDNEVI